MERPVDSASNRTSSGSSNGRDGDAASRRLTSSSLESLEGQQVHGISAQSTKDLPDFTSWLNLYACGKWDPSQPSPFSEHASNASSGSSTSRGERSQSYSSASEAQHSPPGPEYTRFKQDGWLPPPKPPNEEARRRALFRHAILPDANPNGEFDKSFQRITRMAQRALGVAACVILLVEKNHLPVLASVGFDAKIYERESSLCGHTILRNKPHVILDTALDWRLNTTHPYVQGETPIRFYAGTQLKTRDGFNLGTLCCIDTRPHAEFTEDEQETLLEYGELAMKEIELRMTRSHLSRVDRTSQALQILTREVAEMGNLSAASDLPQVYESAANCIRRTLDIESCAILDLSAFQLIKTPGNDGRGARSNEYRYNAKDVVFSPSASQSHSSSSLTVLALSERDPPIAIHPTEEDGFFTPVLDGEAVARFLAAHSDGKLFHPDDKPLWTGYPCPSNVAFTYVAPILAPDQSPVALMIAYTCSPAQEFLEPECQFLQAVGGVVLAALLMRRVQEGDKIKAQFIANMSHELRTPLYGITANSELLADTPLSSAQAQSLRAIQTCSTSLASTINHVLDFTKTVVQSLSGRRESARPIDSAPINLLSFLEDAVTATYVAFQYSTQERAATDNIGALYNSSSYEYLSGGRSNGRSPPTLQCLLDLQDRIEGSWDVMVDAVGLRRVLTNIVGNAFKYTSSGYVKVSLARMPSTPGDDRIPLTIVIHDTGKGMSEEFLRSSCFQPFAQEDSISPGTGLGLAITSNLVRSLGGRISVSSAQGRGSEFTILLNLPPARNAEAREVPSFAGTTVAFIDFHKSNKTLQLQRKILKRYLESWDVVIRSGLPKEGDILIVDELSPPDALKDYPTHKALWATSDRQLTPADPSIEVLVKPVGPLQLEAALRNLLKVEVKPEEVPDGERLRLDREATAPPTPFVLSPRNSTSGPSIKAPVDEPVPTPTSKHRILHVEDNAINRSVLRTFFKKKGVLLDEAVDGLKGMEAFERAPRGTYSVVLMDLSMPVRNGFEATELIRAFEAAQRAKDPTYPHVPIFALTGSSSSEVQQRALSTGFDEFLTKPVSLKALWETLDSQNLV